MRKISSLGLAVIGLFLFLAVLVGVYLGAFTGEDNYFLGLDGGVFVSFGKIMHFLFSTTFFVFLSLVLLVLVLVRFKDKFVFSTFVLFGGAIAGYLVKLLVQRDRPESALIDVDGFSFPSGHTVKATLFFLLIVFLYKDKIKSSIGKWLFVFVNLLLIGLIGLSRIYLNVHWFSDVLGGFLFGLFWISLMAFVLLES